MTYKGKVKRQKRKEWSQRREGRKTAKIEYVKEKNLGEIVDLSLYHSLPLSKASRIGFSVIQKLLYHPNC